MALLLTLVRDLRQIENDSQEPQVDQRSLLTKRSKCPFPALTQLTKVVGRAGRGSREFMATLRLVSFLILSRLEVSENRKTPMNRLMHGYIDTITRDRDLEHGLQLQLTKQAMKTNERKLTTKGTEQSNTAQLGGISVQFGTTIFQSSGSWSVPATR